MDATANPLAQLPLLADRRERQDAAENRRRILEAARRLLLERGVPGVSMDAVAAAANVGKGTIFRRFGDRAGLMHALLDEYMRDFQDAFISGPPPLGPGAPAAQRLDAFTAELLRLQSTHIELALAAEGLPGREPAGAYNVLRLHVGKLVRELAPALDPEVTAAMILGAIAPPVISVLRARAGADLDTLGRSIRALTGGLSRAN